MVLHGVEGNDYNPDHATFFIGATGARSTGARRGAHAHRGGHAHGQAQRQGDASSGMRGQNSPLRIFLVPVTHCPKEAAVALSASPLLPLLPLSQVPRAAGANFL